jgi:hypothetical protein
VRFLLCTVKDPKTKHDWWALSLVGDKKPFPFLRTEFNEEDGRFSPTGIGLSVRRALDVRWP